VKKEFHGTWYSDAPSRRDRFDREFHHGRVDFYRFWVTDSTGTEYENVLDNKTCRGRKFSARPFHTAFGWLSKATKTQRVCHHDGGSVWEEKTSSHHLELCVSHDEKYPVWLQYKRETHPRLEARTVFHGFHAGRPHATSFALPSGCNVAADASMKVAKNQGFKKHPSFRFTNSNSTCSLCQELVAFVQELIARDNTIKQIIEEIRAVCYQIPPPDQQLCLDAVNQEIDALIGWIQDGKNPLEFCAYVGVC